MSKSWSEVIENIDLSTKPLREPRKLSCDEITDLKEKCNPKYDLTILDLICTIEALQQENERLNTALDKAVNMIGDSRCPSDYNSRKCSNYETCLHCWKDWLLGGKEDV